MQMTSCFHYAENKVDVSSPRNLYISINSLSKSVTCTEHADCKNKLHLSNKEVLTLKNKFAQ